MKCVRLPLAAVLLATVAACEVNVQPEADNSAAGSQQQQPGAAATAQPSPQTQQIRNQAREALRDLRVEVDLSDRQLRLLQGDRLVRVEQVAVGTEEWPTPTGSWKIHRVDINPEWIPPKEEEWAEDEEPKAPGAPDNPLGRARIVYRMPNTIHGTYDLASLGKASSHGSIRVANAVALQLAETFLKAGGAWDGPQWFQQMVQTPNREFQIDLPEPIPIEVKD